MSTLHTPQKIQSQTQAQAQVEAWKAAGKQVVFTNGCFDLLHLGHVDYLEKARNLGDCLVVGLNADTSVRRLKGEERPLVTEDDRARVLAALAAVDLVVLFTEDTPQQLIESLAPDVLVKGGDYTLETIVGANFVIEKGGRVETIAFVDGRSTTQLVQKIKGLKHD